MIEARAHEPDASLTVEARRAPRAVREAAAPPPLARVALAALELYRRFVSPLLPQACRYLPTCSDYCAQAITRRGLVAGSGLALRRLLRCHPWSRGGWDPAP